MDDGEVELLTAEGLKLATGRLTVDATSRSTSPGVVWTGELGSGADLASHIAPADHPAPPNDYIFSWSDARRVKIQIPSYDQLEKRAQISGMEPID